MRQKSYYSLVPKDVKANLLFRHKLLERAERNEALQLELRAMCARDPLFWVNVYGWMYDANKPGDVPFVTFPVQDEAILKIWNAIGEHDLLIDKSRMVGGTWMVLISFLHCWQFARKRYKFLLSSRVEPKIDKSDDPDSLFWKWDYALKMQPSWLKPKQKQGQDRTYLKSLNPETGSVATGEPTTAEIGRSGRATAILMDEYGAVPDKNSYEADFSSQFVSRCRIWVSSAHGPTGAFFDKAHDPNIEKITLHWSQIPLYNVGMYVVAQNGSFDAIDRPWHEEHPNYPFVPEPGGFKGLRSPWYDAECRRTNHPQLIAQELDINYTAAVSRFFDGAVLNRHAEDYVIAPYHVGELDFDPDKAAPQAFLSESGERRLKLWCHPTGDGSPPGSRRYAIGADISAGTGASNSCLSVGDARTGEKVASFVTPHLSPDMMARYAAALGRWFKDETGGAAQIICESNGGLNQQFLKTLSELGYGNLYYRRDESRMAPKISDRPGWYSSQETKRLLLEEYGRALKTGAFINRDEEAVDECNEYIFTGNGLVEYIRIKDTSDPSGAGQNHGDRVIADALCWHVLKNWVATEDDIEQKPPVGSLAWRLQQRSLSQSKVDYW